MENINTLIGLWKFGLLLGHRANWAEVLWVRREGNVGLGRTIYCVLQVGKVRVSIRMT
jgi:hypothetical protein